MKRIKLLICLLIIGFATFIPISISASASYNDYYDESSTNYSPLVQDYNNEMRDYFMFLQDKIDNQTAPTFVVPYMYNENFQIFFHDEFMNKYDVEQYSYTPFITTESEIIGKIEEYESRKHTTRFMEIAEKLNLKLTGYTKDEILGIYHLTNENYNNKTYTVDATPKSNTYIVYTNKYYPTLQYKLDYVIYGNIKKSMTSNTTYGLYRYDNQSEGYSITILELSSNDIPEDMIFAKRIELGFTYEHLNMDSYYKFTFDNPFYNYSNNDSQMLKSNFAVNFTERVKDITDYTYRSNLDTTTNTYTHVLYFNTDLTDIKRIDISYILTDKYKETNSELKKYTNRDVSKSLKVTDIINIPSDRIPITKGEFIDSATNKTYSYRLILNVVGSYWKEFYECSVPESRYADILSLTNFKIAYLCSDESSTDLFDIYNPITLYNYQAKSKTVEAVEITVTEDTYVPEKPEVGDILEGTQTNESNVIDSLIDNFNDFKDQNIKLIYAVGGLLLGTFLIVLTIRIIIIIRNIFSSPNRNNSRNRRRF